MPLVQPVLLRNTALRLLSLRLLSAFSEATSFSLASTSVSGYALPLAGQPLSTRRGPPSGLVALSSARS